MQEGMQEFIALEDIHKTYGKGENAFEALMGAVFADGGFEAARPVVKKFLDHRIDEAVKEHRVDDHKGRLQEKAHRKHIKKL